MQYFRTVGQAGEASVSILVHVLPIYEIINFIFWNIDSFGKKVLFYSSYWGKERGKNPSVCSCDWKVPILGKSAVSLPFVRDNEP